METGYDSKHDRQFISMNGKHYRRSLQLKRRVRRLDDLFDRYVIESYNEGYAARIIAAKAKCRNMLGIYLECMIYEA